jgi:2-polyprenyl-3-methyl-5-hydroxy-6-metoxy-1,4-benzoquinol methylase
MTSRDGYPADVARQNRCAYARIAGEWERRQQKEYDHPFHEQCRTLFLKHLSGVRVLDAGCGLGLDSLAFAGGGLTVTAADMVEELLALTRGRAPEIRAAAMDLTAPCFRAGVFDGIFACASFLHVPREAAGETLGGLARLLAMGGVLFLHHVESAKGLTSYCVDDLLVPGNPALCFCHTEAELTALLETAGLRVIEIQRLAPGRQPSPCAERHGLRPYQVVARR